MKHAKGKKILAGIVAMGLVTFGWVEAEEHAKPVFSSLALSLGKAGVLTLLPEGGARRLESEVRTVWLGETETSSAPTISDTPSRRPVSSQPPASSAVSSAPASSEPPSSIPPPPSGAKTGKVLEKFFGKSAANAVYENVYVSNKTSGGIDIAKQLGIRPPIRIVKNKDPMVLILHTHATEAFLAYDYGYFVEGTQTRTTDTKKNICAVGEEIAKVLNDAGIVTLQDKTLHDHPSYNGGYERSAETIKKYLKQYPSIQVVLDIHRDAITYDNGDKVKPTVKIDGKKAAQIMICAGRQDRNVLPFPDWEQNLRFALRIQKQCETDYPGLARPLYFVSKRYNEYLLPGSLLIEVGSEGNTLEEAVYSGRLLGKTLVKVLESLQK